MRGSARIYDVRMAQFVLKIEKLSHIIGARGSQDLRSPSPIMASVKALPAKRSENGYGDENGLSP